MTPPTTTGAPPRRPATERAGSSTRSAERTKAKKSRVSRGGGRGSIDPRISARRTAVTREQGRRRLRILVAGLAGTAALVGIYLVLVHTSLFAARAVTVVGATHESTAQVIHAAGLAARPPLLDVNASSAARAVEQLPWVRSASVHIQWPDGVRIVVEEETAHVTMAVPGGHWATLANDGRVLAITATRPPGLLAIAGPAAAGGVGSTLGPADSVGLAVAATLPASFVGQVTQVTVEHGGWVQLSMTSPVVVDIGTATQLTEKYEDVSSILSGASLVAGDVIDVSVPGSPTVTEG